MLESSFVDEELIKLIKELKDITKKVTEPEEEIFKSKSEQNNKMQTEPKEERKNVNLEKLNHEDDFIRLKDFPKFKNEAQIAEIEKIIEQFRE